MALVGRVNFLVTSFAGRTSRPVAAGGETRVGGFGGAEGLAAYLRDERIDAVVDGTHPFAAVMPHNVAAACELADAPRLRLLRPQWDRVAGDVWHDVDSVAKAAEWVHGSAFQNVFLTIGRQEVAPFAGNDNVIFVVRSVEPATLDGFPHVVEVLARGPFSIEDERALFAEHEIDLVVSKNSGGDATAAKLAVARERSVPVVMVRRPPQPEGRTTASVDEAVDWVRRRSEG